MWDPLSPFSLPLAVLTPLFVGVVACGFIAAVAFLILWLTEKKRARKTATDYHRLRGDFTKANKRAASTRGEKTQILRVAAQELVQPYHELETEVRQLGEQVDLPASASARALRMQELIQRMQRGMQSLQDFQALEERSKSPTLTPINIGAVLAEAVAHVRAAADEKRIRLLLPDPSKTAIGIADAAVLRRALENLIGDAIEVTPTNGAVSFAIYSTEDRVMLTISDEGPGTATADQAQLLSDSGSSRPPFGGSSGTARLNLAMVHNLIKAMDGWLWSQGEPGGGTTHVVELSLPEKARKADSSRRPR